jgi:hypothetical protein
MFNILEPSAIPMVERYFQSGYTLTLQDASTKGNKAIHIIPHVGHLNSNRSTDTIQLGQLILDTATWILE